MKKGLTSGLVLLILGSVCGLLLAVVNYFTAPVIAANELREKMETFRQFYPDIDNFTPEEITTDLPDGIDSIYLLRDPANGDAVAHAIYSVRSRGYTTDVEMLIAIDADLKVKGYAFIGSGGTEGLGLNLSAIDFGMTGSVFSAGATAFDTQAGATITSIGDAPARNTGVRQCFVIVAERVATDFGR
ncbi:MAG: FMN-binding protein [bacterium]